MRTLFLMFDSLNRSALGCYGSHLATPNFDRLARQAMIFDRHYIGSMPCMPARRDLHTGRLNFMHRSWGPLEPFDGSFPECLGRRGVYSHLVSDHYHYFEDGGATYHGRYTTWDFVRGQEADPWVAMVQPPLARLRERYHPAQLETERGGYRLQGSLNMDTLVEAADYPAVRCVDRALEFLESNAAADHWLLQVETFDPHEPFAAPAACRDGLETDYRGPTYNWPRYRRAGEETLEEAAELRANYAALVRLCDDQLGRLLDHFDAANRWDDTALVLTTDHGFLLGEHDWWGKNRMPFFNEIANIPLLVWHPELGSRAGTRCTALTQTSDLMPTFLELFGAEVPAETRGHSLLPLVRGAATTSREVALYGVFGGALNVTDGRHTYFRYPADMEAAPLFEYTLMPMHARSLFTVEELVAAELVRGFDFTRGVPLLRIPARADARRPPMQGGGFADCRDALYDLQTDPGQTRPITDPSVTTRLLDAAVDEMRRHDAPRELYTRFALDPP
ncbi:MAG: sulfatase [Pseudomonadota bacterium]